MIFYTAFSYDMLPDFYELFDNDDSTYRLIKPLPSLDYDENEGFLQPSH